MNFNLNNIVKEWSYRVHDGMPDMKNPLHMVELQRVLHERKYPRKFIETLLNRLREAEASWWEKKSSAEQSQYLKDNPASKKKLTKSLQSKATQVAPKKTRTQKLTKKGKPSKLTKHAQIRKGREEKRIERAKEEKQKRRKEKVERRQIIKQKQDYHQSLWDADDPNPSEEALEDQKTMLKSLAKKGFEKHFKKDMKEQNNITDTTITGRDATEDVYNILEKNDDIEKYDEYEPITFESLGKSGNAVDILMKESGLSRETITGLLIIQGQESGRGVGKAEIGVATLTNTKMASAGGGDLDWNGQSLECKGSGGRLGGRDERFKGNFNETKLGLLATKHGVERNIVTKKGVTNDNTMISTIFMSLVAQGVSKKELSEALIEFEEIAHPYGNAKKYFTEDAMTDWKSVRAAFAKNLVADYAKRHKEPHFLFMDTKVTRKKWDKNWMDGVGVEKVNNEGRTYFERPNLKFGNFQSFATDEADALVEEGHIAFGSIGLHQLDPAISKP
jgi:hypothetical protein